ncbi:hypothetical protein D3C87_2080050 [compost metagenome]
MPFGFETERTGLLLEIGELPARHLMEIDFGSRPLEIAFEGCILAPHRFPIEGDAADPFRIKTRVTLGAR